MPPTPSLKRPKLTPKILFYAIFDVVGMFVFATGALWLTQGTNLLLSGFPTSKAEAIAATAAGVFLMFWAATQILRELLLLRRPANKPGESR